MAPPESIRVPFPQTPAVAYRKEERLHTCCHCLNSYLLIQYEAGLVRHGAPCSVCKHRSCCDCVYSTLEVHDNPYISRDGRLVTIEPFGPNKRTGFLVQFEMQRRREQGWPATENGDEVSDTEPSSGDSSVVETLPDAWQASKDKTIKDERANGVNTTTTMNKRKQMATPRLSHATRMTRAQAKLANGVNTPTLNKRKRQSTTPRSATPNVLDDDEDGKCFHPRRPAIC